MPPKRDCYQGQWAFLTHSRLSADAPDLPASLRAMRDQLARDSMEVTEYVVCREMHAPDEKGDAALIWHLHWLLHMPMGFKHKAAEFTYPVIGRTADIKMLRSKPADALMKYLVKGDKWARDTGVAERFPPTYLTNTAIGGKHPSANYVRVKADMAAWQADEEKKLEPPIVWPQAYLTITIPEPAGENRRRHIYVYGRSDVGKTYGTRALRLYRCGGEPKYRFERYKGESLVLYDDCYPGSWEEMVAVCDEAFQVVDAPGGSRYTPIHFKPGQLRVVMIVSNRQPPWWTYDDPTAAARWNTRFRVYEAQAGPGGCTLIPRDNHVV